MTDNRTTELLREGLTERGVEYQAIGKRLTYWNRDGSKNDCDDADFVADEQNGYLIVEGLTPDQAIAATLGTEYHGYEQAAIEAWKSIKAWNTRATHGTLTAEQVRDVIERHSMWVNGNNRCFHNGAYEDIADELNADLGVGECEIVTTERWLPAERYHRCKICGAFFAVNACPNCGRW